MFTENETATSSTIKAKQSAHDLLPRVESAFVIVKTFSVTMPGIPFSLHYAEQVCTLFFQQLRTLFCFVSVLNGTALRCQEVAQQRTRNAIFSSFKRRERRRMPMVSSSLLAKFSVYLK